jgi:DNA-directed RNA polymerase sigma subunit (sigma70/sigma32)
VILCHVQVTKRKSAGKKVRSVRNRMKKNYPKLKHSYKLYRSYKVLLLRSEGKTYKEIGEIFGISGQRVRQIFYNAIIFIRRCERSLKENGDKIKYK